MEKNEVPRSLDLRHHQELFLFMKGDKKLDPYIYEGSHFKVAKVEKWLRKILKKDWVDTSTVSQTEDL